MRRILFSTLAVLAIATAPAYAGAVGQKFTRYDSAGNYQSTVRDFEYKLTKLNKADVKDIQIALREAGFRTGPIDGVIGPQTRRGVKAFQYHSNLPVTGKIDGRTLRQLKVHSWRFYDHRRHSNYN